MRVVWAVATAGLCGVGCDRASPDIRRGGGGGEFYDGPLVLMFTSVSCGEGDRVRLYAETAGWTDGGSALLVETSSGDAAPRSEAHELVSVSFDPRGRWDELERILAPGAWEPGESTAFACPEARDLERMTFAFAVVDLDGRFADCLAFGHDPEGLVAGAYETVRVPFDPVDCGIGRIVTPE
jgi:hypothetical protein